MSPVTLPAREPPLAFDVVPVSLSCPLHLGVQTESVLYAGRSPRCPCVFTVVFGGCSAPSAERMYCS